MSYLICRGCGCGVTDDDVSESEPSPLNSSSGRDALAAGGSVDPDVAAVSALAADVGNRDFVVVAPLVSVGALAAPLLCEAVLAAPPLSAAAVDAPSNSATSS